MPTALLLGKPCHGDTLKVAGAPARLDVPIEEIPDKRYATGYGGTTVGGRKVITVPYFKLRIRNAPTTALVYGRRDYIPQEEDEELVLRTFSDRG